MPKNRLEQLCEAHPWLRELDQDAQLGISSLRQAFLTDGRTFILVLGEFLNVIKWQEFVLQTCILDGELGPVLFELLNFVFKTNRADKISFDRRMSSRPSNLDGLGLSDKSRMLCPGLVQAINSRYSESIALPPKKYFTMSEELIANLEKSLESRFRLSLSSLTQIRKSIQQLDFTQMEAMTFGFNITGVAAEPAYLLFSARWKSIGRNLCTLGLLVGADVPRSFDDPKPVTLVTALKAIVNNEVTAVNIMLARLEEQNAMMRKQQQVITALQFRHLLEHLPRTLRGRKVTAAGEGQAGVAVAMRWDHASEVERWLEFWDEAVKQVYAVYKEHNDPKWSPTTDEGLKLKPSPFAKLLEKYLNKAKEKGDDTAAVRWLTYESYIAQHMKDLYSTLSQIIHQFSDGKFMVDPLNFSPSDARILAALVPEQSEDGTVDWKKEFRRYVWAQLETAGPAKPQVEAKASNEEVLTRIRNLWESLRPNSPLPRLLFDRLTVLSAIQNSKGPRITASYRPATADIDCNWHAA